MSWDSFGIGVLVGILWMGFGFLVAVIIGGGRR